MQCQDAKKCCFLVHAMLHSVNVHFEVKAFPQRFVAVLSDLCQAVVRFLFLAGGDSNPPASIPLFVVTKSYVSDKLL